MFSFSTILIGHLYYMLRRISVRYRRVLGNYVTADLVQSLVSKHSLDGIDKRGEQPVSSRLAHVDAANGGPDATQCRHGSRRREAHRAAGNGEEGDNASQHLSFVEPI